VFARSRTLKAVDGVSFNVGEDSVFAIVGESGCGKSTLGRLMVRLLDPTSGAIFFKERDIVGLKGESLKQFRKEVQIVFQDPYASLNPRMKIATTLSEPLKIHRIAPGNSLKDRVAELLASVGLSPDVMNKYPHEFSGGQRQRICIARALSLSPELIVADEPLSALDVSIQAQILTLLQELKEARNLSFVFISHDLNIVHYFSDEVAVMYLGEIVEQAPTEKLFQHPLHPYTELLLKSAPRVHGEAGVAAEKGKTGTGDVPSPIDIPPGCPFHPRCSRRFSPCDRIVPGMRERDGHLVKCLLYE
jgi:peptide/nickel transport system ATP-binding protein/oligopeptide transport system ATP-binding protein